MSHMHTFVCDNSLYVDRNISSRGSQTEDIYDLFLAFENKFDFWGK
jgi:hypothetical protein